jgi:hypothetical protein
VFPELHTQGSWNASKFKGDAKTEEKGCGEEM